MGDILQVSADIFKDGHDKIAAVIKYRRRFDEVWQEAEMRYVDNDRWAGEVLLTDNTRYVYTIEAFPDVFATWRDEIEKKVAAEQDVALELIEGRMILAEALQRAEGDDRAVLEEAIAAVDAGGNQAATVRHLLSPEVEAAMRRARSRRGAAVYRHELEVVVDRPAARFAAWYEMFPRSAGTDPTRSATFSEAAERLPAIAEMGFSVVYLTPIHPIGRAFRKGRNNTLNAGPDDPGVPYAIGSPEGGHDAIEPGLGTLDDFRAFVARAEALGMEVALDVALQASPDHPWAQRHPDWFTIRPDGTIRYAENPPKKYQDIYPLNFDSPEWRELWLELRRVIHFWIDQGVKAFRVDNPHTKPTIFWEWLIADVQRQHPDVDLPLRGLHPTQGDEVARQGRFHPELHLLHLAQLQGGAGGVLHRAHPERDEGVLPRQPLPQHPRHPAVHPARGRATRLQDALRPGYHPLLGLRHLLRL